MGNNRLGENENILVKVDVNNLIFIDPNSVQNGDKIEERGVKQENLVMYVNLEADLVPRSTLTADGGQASTGALTSIAKGTLNFLGNKGPNGKDYDTSWTDSYTGTDTLFGPAAIKNDQTAQSFGIDSININIKGASFIPQININFVDVRGKTLFESPQNSPYGAFFHLPWPIFYLTIKGYYGKAIRYRLHLTKFSSKYNESNGNFEIATTFVGSTYAYLNDIPLNGILNAPYMYMIESDEPAKYIESKGVQQKKIKKSSKGYVMLKSVYDEYKQKGLIASDFPTKTLRELIVVARSLDKILEKEIFGGLVDMKLFAGIEDFEKKIQQFENAVKNWSKVNLSAQIISIDGVDYNTMVGQNKNSDLKIKGATNAGTLEQIITDFPKKLLQSKIFTENFIQKASQDFKKQTFGFTNKIKGIDSYVIGPKSFGYAIAIQSLLKDIFDIQREFVQQRNKLQDIVEKRMNEIIKDKNKGIGFEPTIRNIFAVILANADVYIRLMKEVHYKAFEVGSTRRELLSGFSDESKRNDSIYPWPEVKKTTANKQKVVAYPGDPDLQRKLQTYNRYIWPEIDFLENYQAVGTKRHDALTNKEGSASKIDFIFENDTPNSDTTIISTLFNLHNGVPYVNKSIASIIYEIYERARYSVLNDEFSDYAIIDLANTEFENISKMFEEDSDIVTVLKTIDSKEKLQDYLLSFSPFERYPYFQDKLPTLTYIKSLEETPFRIGTSYGNTLNKDNNSKFLRISNDLKNLEYNVNESYRYKIYPFNSSLYLNYLDKDEYNSDDLNIKNLFEVKTTEGFIVAPKLPINFVKPGKSGNLFNERIQLNKTSSANILNTPYFHQQLNSDFNKSPYGKYVGSAYLLLNSLPFLDLEDKFDYVNGTTRLSSVFKEVAATHYVPYHLILKWGSLYHRYKKYLIDGVDILRPIFTGATTTITSSFNGATFFDNGNNQTYNINGQNVKRTTNNLIGLHPFYDSIYHQIINGYTHFQYYSGNTTGYTLQITNKVINTVEENMEDGGKYYTTFVDNSKTSVGDKWFTLLPSVGGTKPEYIAGLDYNGNEQKNMKILWCYDDESINTPFTGKTFFSYNQYNRSYDDGVNFYELLDFDGGFFTGLDKSDDNKYSLKKRGSNRKIIDLIATFSPQILDGFEECFLDFASEKIIEEIPYKKFADYVDKSTVNNETKDVKKYSVKYSNFQDLLKALVTIDADANNDNTEPNAIIQTLKTKQLEKLKQITTDILSDSNLLKITIANPKEIIPNVWYGFAGVDGVNTFSYNEYSESQYTTENQNFLKLYIGEDVDLLYKQFFITNKVELSEENILTFRPLIHIFAGGYSDGLFLTKEEFQSYLKTKVLNQATARLNSFLDTLVPQLTSLTIKSTANEATIFNGYNDTPLKLELYNFFKSFNDKWVAGNSLGQKTLLEEFLFLDKANKDIGDQAYLTLEKLLPLEDSKNDNANLYSVISMLIQGTGFDMRALPSYINFYGTNHTTKSRIVPSKKIANNMFGTFLDVDYQDSSPKIVIQYVGPTSKHLELEDINKKYNFKNDSGNLFSGVGSPLVITAPQVFLNGDLSKSNKVVAFEVSIGDENQGIFKSVQLDQTSIKNTTESFNVIENLGRSESGAGAQQIDIGLFDIYRQASYTCDVTCMGNVMIQPTMYFYLKNVPLFRGSYWITEVTHNIRNNNIVTSFKGTRIPFASLPDPKDSFLSSYRVLFDKVTRSAVAKTKELENSTLTGSTKNENNVTTADGNSVTIDNGGKPVKGEELVKFMGCTKAGIPYNGWNGEKYVQKVTYKNETYLRAIAITMGGPNYPINDDISMSVIARQDIFNVYNTTLGNADDKVLLKWSNIKDSKNHFYSLKFDYSVAKPNTIITGTGKFYKPTAIEKPVIVAPIPSTTTQILTKDIVGPVNNGPNLPGYGIGLSKQLMKDLDIQDGDVVYFNVV
jgi:hypothetical protein